MGPGHEECQEWGMETELEVRHFLKRNILSQTGMGGLAPPSIYLPRCTHSHKPGAPFLPKDGNPA